MHFDILSRLLTGLSIESYDTFTLFNHIQLLEGLFFLRVRGIHSSRHIYSQYEDLVTQGLPNPTMTEKGVIMICCRFCRWFRPSDTYEDGYWYNFQNGRREDSWIQSGFSNPQLIYPHFPISGRILRTIVERTPGFKVGSVTLN